MAKKTDFIATAGACPRFPVIGNRGGNILKTLFLKMLGSHIEGIAYHFSVLVVARGVGQNVKCYA